MKILVTGGTGFLGKNLLEVFKADPQGHQAIFVGSSYDLTKELDTFALFQNTKPDVVLHAGALAAGIKGNSERPADFLRVNLQMGINIFEMAREFEVKKVYTLGSVCAFPVDCPTPFKEDNLWNGKPEITNFPYGLSKRVLMTLGETYRQQYGIGGAHLIPVNLYGPHDWFEEGSKSHVVPALIYKFVKAKEKNLPEVKCWGSGKNTRELFYSEDAAEVIWKAVFTNLDTSLPINLGTGVSITIADLAALIGNLVQYTGNIVFTGEVSDGQPKRQLDVSRVFDLLEWKAKTTLEDGLKKTINWYKNNRNP